MIRLVETATTSLPRSSAFEHIGDFANIDKWDPGVISSKMSTSGPVAVGTVYDVEISYGGRRMNMQYEITEYEAGRRIVLAGSGSTVKAIDVIEFAEHDDGTLITYTADIGLTGLLRFVEPFIKGRLAQVGVDAGVGMRRWLAELEQAAEVDG